MTFAEKLDFLMNITRTSNSALAGRVALDASYISRLRSGKRLMPKNVDIIRSMAVYFARHVDEAYQKKAISDTLGIASVPEAAGLTEDLVRWLLHDDADNSQRIGQFLSGISNLGHRPEPARQAEAPRPSSPENAASVYYGSAGKRQAAEYFLCEVAAEETPQTLLLFSDEDTGWMTDDPAFLRRWAELMVLVLSRGNRIQIIHTISRDLDEMLSAISQWMPLYMSGLIEPYFYPKKRDGIFKRTLFIAPQTAAVVSSSVGDQISTAANILYRDPAIVRSFAEEFLHYLRLCRPLMRIFTNREQEECYATLTEFEQEQANALIRTESLSLLTMPEDLLAQILQRAGLDGKAARSVHGIRHKRFLERLSASCFTEIITLPDMETVTNSRVKVSMSDMLSGGAVYYRPQEFISHLEHVISLLASYENYHVHFTAKTMVENYTIYAREELGVIVAKTSLPPVVLAMSEGNITAAFWDFLKGMVDEKTYTAPDKKKALATLQTYLGKLKTHCHA